MQLFVYEDEKTVDLLPLVLLRPIFDLLIGTTTLLEKIQKVYPQTNPHLLTRGELAPTVKEKYPSLTCNEWESAFGRQKEGLFLNGRTLFSLKNKIPLLGKEEVFLSEEEIIGFRISSDRLSPKKLEIPFKENFAKEILKNLPKREVRAKTIQHLWNLIEWNGSLITEESDFLGTGKIEGTLDEKAAIQGDPSSLSIGKGSKVGPFCLLDLREGPILVGQDVQILPPTVIEGPAFIGDGTHIDGAKIRGGTSIGPNCRISGEVEETIFQGYSNKHHEGFLGHSYIGEWVNLGAGTTNSDLKNNYGEIRVVINSKEMNTRNIKVGCFIGDHTKTGIGTLINTGAVFGIFCNLFGGKEVSPKFVPSFSWGARVPFASYRIEEAIDTARKGMGRRGVEMTKNYEDLIRETYAKFHPSSD